MRTRFLAIVVLAALLLGCGKTDRERPNFTVTGPTSVTSQTAPFNSAAGGVNSAVEFPPRDQPLAFRVLLEAKYRDGLRRPTDPTPSFVDIEGQNVWTSEYLRYRVNGCGHAEGTQRVFAQIDQRGVQPVCSSVSSSFVAFPPRDQPLDFRGQLEIKYRDGLGRTTPITTPTFVDIEGQNVWTAEYLRYRVNGCNHTQATEKVFQQIDGLGVQPVCLAAPPTPPEPPPGNLVAKPGGPYGPVNAGTPIILNGLSSTSTPNPIAHYFWTCGQPGNTSCTKDSPTPSFVYVKTAALGTTVTYTVTLTIEDTKGLRSAPVTTTVRVTQVYGS